MVASEIFHHELYNFVAVSGDIRLKRYKASSSACSMRSDSSAATTGSFILLRPSCCFPRFMPIH